MGDGRFDQVLVRPGRPRVGTKKFGGWIDSLVMRRGRLIVNQFNRPQHFYELMSLWCRVE